MIAEGMGNSSFFRGSVPSTCAQVSLPPSPKSISISLSFPSFPRDGKLAMIRLFSSSFEDYVMPVVRSPRSVFSVAKISCREEASLLAFFIGFEAAVESRSSKHGCTCGNCKHFQPSWNLVVEFCHWLQIAHLSWKCLVRVCRRLENVIRMFRHWRYSCYVRWLDGRFALGILRLSFRLCVIMFLL